MASELVVQDSDEGRDDDALSQREEQFCYAYVSQGFNKARAYRAISPNTKGDTSQQMGLRYYNRPRVKAFIEQLVEQNAMTAAEVLTEIGNVARSSMGDCFEWQEQYRIARFDPSLAFESGAIHQMKRMSVNQDGTVTVQMHDKVAALTLLAKVYGLTLDGDGEAATREVIFYIPQNARDIPNV